MMHFRGLRTQAVRMLVASAAGRAINKTTGLKDACELVWAQLQVRAELLDLIEVLATRVVFST